MNSEPPQAPRSLSLTGRLARAWSPTPDRGSVAPTLWRLWRRNFTETGRLLSIVLMVAGAVSLSIGVHFPLYQMGLFLVLALGVGRVGGMFFRPRVVVERVLPDRVAAGATIVVRAIVTGKGPLPAFDVSLTELLASAQSHRVRLEERATALATLRAGERAELTYTLEVLRRGAYDWLGPEAFTSFPFGLYRVPYRIRDPHRMLVTPRFQPLARIDLPVSSKHQPGGLQLVSQVGDSEEFVGNREYRSGDRLRDLDQRAWARVGYPVVREFQQEYLSRVALVVDTYIGRRRDALALEAAISLGASVADALSRQEYVIDFFAAGPDLLHFQAGRSLAYLDSVLDVLACVEGNPANPFPVLTPAILDAVAQISTAVIVLLDWDADRLRFVRVLRDVGVEVKVIVVRDGAPTLDVAGFAAESRPITVLTPEQVDGGVGVL